MSRSKTDMRSKILGQENDLWHDPEAPPYEERFKPKASLDRDFDTTQLKMSQFQHQPHKDYLGHVFRWGFVSRHVDNKSRILDAGCGQETPMLLSLGGSSRATVPELYLGVDVNPIPDPPRRKWARVMDRTNVVDVTEKLRLLYESFNLVVSLEVYEHIAPRYAMGYLRALRELVSDDGKLILSTPVYCHSFKMARNHINERTKREIEHDLHEAGFKIVGQYGTFGNYRDLAKTCGMLSDEYEKMREFYGDDVLGCYLAPLFPEASRNITHVCVPECEVTEDVEECELRDSVLR